MTADEFRADLETDLAVLILYSHLEGYIKLSLQTYIQYINSLELSRNMVTVGLKTASMNREFNAYDNPDRKCNVFRRELPDDSRLHKFFRRVDFMSQYEEFVEQNLEIDDDIVNTESNLWYIVLQKNLYKLGLPIDLFQEYKSDIDALVNRRNSIAHGNFRSGISEGEFHKWETGTIDVLNGVTRLLYDYAHNERYMKTE